MVYEPALRIVRYVERYFQRHDRTEFPTVRQVARAVRLRQQEVWDIAEAEDDLMLTAYYTVPPQPQGQWFVETL